MMNKPKKILAVASAGGHWVQLNRLTPAFTGFQIEYLSTAQFNQAELNGKLHVVTDANFSEKLKLVVLFAQVFWVLLKVRPDVVISTGAAPGLFAIFLTRIMGAKTIWIDSIANSEKLSASGKVAKYFAKVWLTQWPNLSVKNGPQYWGSVI